MIRGTTPTHTFTLPFPVDTIKEFRVIYGQCDNVILQKKGTECQMEGNEVRVRLTQEDTFKFECKPVRIQVRVLTTAGESLVSPVRLVSIEDCMSEEVLK